MNKPHSSESAKVISLSASDADRIVALEQRCFIPPLQAKRETVLRRLALGHRMSGIDVEGELYAMICLRYGWFEPGRDSDFPATETGHCLRPNDAPFNAAFIYNLEVEPRSRGSLLVRDLILTTLAQAVQDGCRFAVATARIPSYNGSDPRFTQEVVPQNLEFRQAIDRYLAGGAYPTREEFLLDPCLALYNRFGNCNFSPVLPGFAPGDTPSGEMRVICWRDIAQGGWA